MKILKFLWKWKLANVMTLLYATAPERSFWQFYRLHRRLFLDGYIKGVSDSKSSILMWTLTKKGFQYIDDGSMELVQKRYQPQSLAHDYWAMAFQIGEFILQKPSNVDLVSEQEFSAREIADLPPWVPQTKEHIPDGLTRIVKASGPEIVAFEVELSTKSDSRYEDMIRYLDQKEEITWAVWLCESERLIQKITQKIIAVNRRRKSMHNFVLLKDVQTCGWSAHFLWGKLKGQSLLDVMAISAQQPPSKAGQSGVGSTSAATMQIYLSNVKSPGNFNGLRDSVDPLRLHTP